MTIQQDSESMAKVSEIMAMALQDLHKFIEIKNNNPQETMVLMMSFATGLLIQLKDKLETLEKGLGNKFISTVNDVTSPVSKGVETIEKLQKDDLSLKKSTSGVNPNDPLAAIRFLEKNMRNDVQRNIDSLPLVLRNGDVLLHALTAFVSHLLVGLSSGNAKELIEAFSKNIAILANNTTDPQKPIYN